MKVSFLGDISLNGAYETMYQLGEEPFEDVSNILKGTTVIGNLECFARGDNGVNKLKKPRLETNLEALSYVKDFNLQIACIANNHIFDHLEDGFKKTVNFLEENNIKYIGASLDSREFSKPLIIEENGVKVGLLNYVTKDTNPNPPQGIKINLNWFDSENTIVEIKRLKKEVNHVVVSLHWGGRVEGGMYPDWEQPNVAKQLIDAGADLIIGHHSHTVQPYEIYKGKYIFYSLGNFCFSDIYNDGVLYSRLSPRQKKGLIPKISFSKNSYSVSINYILNTGSAISIMKKPLWTLFNKSCFFIIKEFKLIWDLYFFKFKKINPIYNYIFVQKKSPFRALKISKIKRFLFS